jgi:hypothetical protein
MDGRPSTDDLLGVWKDKPAVSVGWTWRTRDSWPHTHVCPPGHVLDLHPLFTSRDDAEQLLRYAANGAHYDVVPAGTPCDHDGPCTP